MTLKTALSHRCPACGALPNKPCTALQSSTRFNVEIGDRLKYTHPERDIHADGYGRVHNQEKVK